MKFFLPYVMLTKQPYDLEVFEVFFFFIATFILRRDFRASAQFKRLLPHSFCIDHLLMYSKLSPVVWVKILSMA